MEFRPVSRKLQVGIFQQYLRVALCYRIEKKWAMPMVKVADKIYENGRGSPRATDVGPGTLRK